MSLPLHTDIAYVFDRSGSMYTMGDTVKNQLSESLSLQLYTYNKTHTSIHVTVTTFDSVSHTYIDNLPIQEIGTLPPDQLNDMLEPRDTTKCRDTIYDEIMKQQQRITDYKNNLSHEAYSLDPTIIRIIYVLTDGLDNCSVNVSSQELKDYVLQEREDGLETFLLAANQNALHLANEYGFNEKTALTIGNDPTTSSIGMEFANEMLRNVSEGSADIPSFTPAQRELSQGATAFD